MKVLSSFLKVIFMASGFFMISLPAHAYIAPLIGVAGVVATLAIFLFTAFLSVFYIFYSHLKGFFTGKKPTKEIVKDENENKN